MRKQLRKDFLPLNIPAPSVSYNLQSLVFYCIWPFGFILLKSNFVECSSWLDHTTEIHRFILLYLLILYNSFVYMETCLVNTIWCDLSFAKIDRLSFLSPFTWSIFFSLSGCLTQLIILNKGAILSWHELRLIFEHALKPKWRCVTCYFNYQRLAWVQSVYA